MAATLPGEDLGEDPGAFRERAQRRVLRVLVAAQVFGGAGLAAGVSVGALLAEDVLGSTSNAGLPAALFTIGSAGAAVSVGRISQRHGRRVGLSAGFAAGAAGGVGVVIGAVTGNVPLLLVSLLVYGAGTATNLQCRYAAADLALESQRGKAVSRVLVATTIGAVAGPNLLRLTGELAERAGMPRLSGPFVLAALAYAIAGAILAVLLRPDPLLTARRLAAASAGQGLDGEEHARPVTVPSTPPAATATATAAAAAAGEGADHRGRRVTRPLVLAASGMILAQAVMVAVMTMTPVHLEHHHHGLGVVGFVIGLHVGAMYLPSPVTGRLVDRYTPGPVVVAGGAVLVGAGLLAAASGGHAATLAVALVLLGLGWNLALVSGTALVTDLTTLADRARTQGTVDLGVALAGAVGGLASGVVLAATSFEALAVVSAGVALLVLPAAAARRDPSPASRSATP